MTTALNSRYLNTQIPQTPNALEYSEDGYLAANTGSTITIYSVGTQHGGLHRSSDYLTAAHIAQVGLIDSTYETSLFCSNALELGEEIGARLTHVSALTKDVPVPNLKSRREEFYDPINHFVDMAWSRPNMKGECHLATVSSRGLVQIHTFPLGRLCNTMDCVDVHSMIKSAADVTKFQACDPTCITWSPYTGTHPIAASVSTFLAVGCKRAGTLMVLKVDFGTQSAVPSNITIAASIELCEGDWITSMCWLENAPGLTNGDGTNSVLVVGTSRGIAIVVSVVNTNGTLQLKQLFKLFAPSRCTPITHISHSNLKLVVIRGQEVHVIALTPTSTEQPRTPANGFQRTIRSPRQVSSARLTRRGGQTYLVVCHFDGSLNVNRLLDVRGEVKCDGNDQISWTRELLSSENEAGLFFRHGDKGAIDLTPMSKKSPVDAGFAASYGCWVSPNSALCICLHLETELRHLYQGRLRRPLSTLLIRSSTCQPETQLKGIFESVFERSRNTGQIDVTDVSFAVMDTLFRVNGANELKLIQELEKSIKECYISATSRGSTEYSRDEVYLKMQCACAILESLQIRQTPETKPIFENWDVIIGNQWRYGLRLWNYQCLKRLANVSAADANSLPGFKLAALYHCDLSYCIIRTMDDPTTFVLPDESNSNATYPLPPKDKLVEITTKVYEMFGSNSDLERMASMTMEPPTRTTHHLLNGDGTNESERVELPSLDTEHTRHKWDQALGLSHNVSNLNVPRSCISMRLLLYVPTLRCINCGSECEADDTLLTSFLAGRVNLHGEVLPNPDLPQNTCSICFGRMSPVDAFAVAHPTKRQKFHDDGPSVPVEEMQGSPLKREL